MRKEEKRRKLHDALLTILYPPPPSPPQQEADECEVGLNKLPNALNADLIPDESGVSDSSSASLGEEEDDSGSRKLTRAQRKRLRKKKLKEEARRRGNIIGPLLPDCSGCSGDLRNDPEGVRPNDADKSEVGVNIKESTACTSQDKLKHRRVAKKLSRERSKPSDKKKVNQDCGHCSSEESLARTHEQ